MPLPIYLYLSMYLSRRGIKTLRGYPSKSTVKRDLILIDLDMIPESGKLTRLFLFNLMAHFSMFLKSTNLTEIMTLSIKSYYSDVKLR